MDNCCQFDCNLCVGAILNVSGEVMEKMVFPITSFKVSVYCEMNQN